MITSLTSSSSNLASSVTNSLPCSTGTSETSFESLLSTAQSGTARSHASVDAFARANSDKSTITDAEILGYSKDDMANGGVPDDFLVAQQYLNRAEIASAIKSGAIDVRTANAWDINKDGIIAESEVELWSASGGEIADVVPDGVSGTEYDSANPFGSVLMPDNALAIRYGTGQLHDVGEMPFDGDIVQDWQNGIYKKYTAEMPGVTATLDCTAGDPALTLDVTDPEKVRMGFAQGAGWLQLFVIDTDNDGVPDVQLDESWLSNPDKVTVKIAGQEKTLQDCILSDSSKGVGELVGWDEESRKAWGSSLT
jgi:hypothetical protein